MNFPGGAMNGGVASLSIPGQGFNMSTIVTAAVFIGCLLLMVIALFVVKGIKRRRS